METYTYALRVRSLDLLNAIKQIQMTKGKDRGYTLGIFQKNGKVSCTLLTGSDISQGTCKFNGDLQIFKMENDKQILSDEPLKEAIKMTMSSDFAEAVAAVAFEEVIFLKISQNIVEVINTLSTIPISIKDIEQVLTSLKEVEKLTLTLDRNEVAKSLKYVSLGASGGSYGANYAFRPKYDGEREILSVYAATDTVLTTGEMGILKTNSKEFPSLCDQLGSTHLEAALFDQILAVNDCETIYMDFFHRETSGKREVIQVKLRTRESSYIIIPHRTGYPLQVLDILKDSYDTQKYGITFDVKTIRKVIPVLGVGSDRSKKRVEIHVYPGYIIICDVGGLKADKKRIKTTIKEVKISMPDGVTEGCFEMGLNQLSINLRPYEGMVTLGPSNYCNVIKGADENIRHCIAPLKPSNGGDDDDENSNTDVNDNEDGNVDVAEE